MPNRKISETSASPQPDVVDENEGGMMMSDIEIGDDIDLYELLTTEDNTFSKEPKVSKEGSKQDMDKDAMSRLVKTETWLMKKDQVLLDLPGLVDVGISLSIVLLSSEYKLSPSVLQKLQKVISLWVGVTGKGSKLGGVRSVNHVRAVVEIVRKSKAPKDFQLGLISDVISSLVTDSFDSCHVFTPLLHEWFDGKFRGNLSIFLTKLPPSVTCGMDWRVSSRPFVFRQSMTVLNEGLKRNKKCPLQIVDKCLPQMFDAVNSICSKLPEKQSKAIDEAFLRLCMTAHRLSPSSSNPSTALDTLRGLDEWVEGKISANSGRVSKLAATLKCQMKK